jgi:hypothetical protein
MQRVEASLIFPTLKEEFVEIKGKNDRYKNIILYNLRFKNC